jgi:hypothetical protein
MFRLFFLMLSCAAIGGAVWFIAQTDEVQELFASYQDSGVCYGPGCVYREPKGASKEFPTFVCLPQARERKVCTSQPATDLDYARSCLETAAFLEEMSKNDREWKMARDRCGFLVMKSKQPPS